MRTWGISHNIPSPYRLHLFRVLARRLEREGIALKIHLMAPAHADRPGWQADLRNVPFGVRLHRDLGPLFRGMRWHLNPTTWAELAAGTEEVQMYGGIWDSLTNVLAPVLSRRSLRLAWLEANTWRPGRLGPLSRGIKTALLRACDALVVPGSEGARWAREVLEITDIPVLILPNLVDEDRFGNTTGERTPEIRKELRIEEGERLALWVARLIPEKGLPEFLNSLDSKVLGGWQIRIVGDGPLRARVEEVIRDRGLANRVAIAALRSYEEMPDLYAAADLCLLPSLQDSNPLAMIEALHGGRPILASERVGNFREAIVEGETGWGLNPGEPGSVRIAAAKAFGASPGELKRCGLAARARAQERFDSERTVDSFVRQVLALT